MQSLELDCVQRRVVLNELVLGEEIVVVLRSPEHFQGEQSARWNATKQVEVRFQVFHAENVLCFELAYTFKWSR